LQSFLKICLSLLCVFCSAGKLSAQLTVTGTVFDSTKRNFVANVKVESAGGKFTQTDSMGHYRIQVAENDSLSFIYQNKPTQKFAVKDIPDLTQFDISLRVHVKGGYSTLKEVVIYARSYRQDSIENRQTYDDVYNYRKPTIHTSISPSGAVGADVNEIINMFRFRRNKQLKAFQARLEQQEQDKFVSYRFNKNFVRRITQLQGAELDTFMVRYLPTYEFASTADEVTFNKYILNASYAFKIELLKQDAPKLPGQAKN
jgi:predicted transport protein